MTHLSKAGVLSLLLSIVFFIASCGGGGAPITTTLNITGVDHVMVGSVAQFIATIDGMPAQSGEVTWTAPNGGAVTQTGAFSATTPGTFSVVATSGTLVATASINVIPFVGPTQGQTIVGAITGFRAGPDGNLLRNVRITHYTGNVKHEIGVGDSEDRGLEHAEVEYWDVTAKAWKFREITDSVNPTTSKRFVKWDWSTEGRGWRAVQHNDFLVNLLGSDLIGIPDPDGDNCADTTGTVWVEDGEMGDLYAYLNPGIQKATQPIPADMTLVTQNSASQTIIHKDSFPWMIPAFGAGAILGQMLVVAPAVCPVNQFPEKHCLKNGGTTTHEHTFTIDLTPTSGPAGTVIRVNIGGDCPDVDVTNSLNSTHWNNLVAPTFFDYTVPAGTPVGTVITFTGTCDGNSHSKDFTVVDTAHLPLEIRPKDVTIVQNFTVDYSAVNCHGTPTWTATGGTIVSMGNGPDGWPHATYTGTTVGTFTVKVTCDGDSDQTSVTVTAPNNPPVNQFDGYVAEIRPYDAAALTIAKGWTHDYNLMIGKPSTGEEFTQSGVTYKWFWDGSVGEQSSALEITEGGKKVIVHSEFSTVGDHTLKCVATSPNGQNTLENTVTIHITP